jgi:hypothetical protein
MHVVVVTIDIKPEYVDRFVAPPILGCGPNLFPEDADWDRSRRER